MASSDQYEEASGVPIHMGDVVTIKITSGEQYPIHARLLTRFSKYFERALRNPLKERRELAFDISEHATPETLSIFVRWIYRREFETDEEYNPTTYYKYLPHEETLVNAWLLGDYFQAVDFTNDIIVLLISHGDTFEVAVLGETWDMLEPFPQLRTLLVDLSCKSILADDVKCREARRDTLNNLPPEALVEVTLRLFDGLKNINQRIQQVERAHKVCLTWTLQRDWTLDRDIESLVEAARYWDEIDAADYK